MSKEYKHPLPVLAKNWDLKDRRPSVSFEMLFNGLYAAFKVALGMSIQEGSQSPYIDNRGKEKAKMWRTLNGYKWTITIERERAK